MDPTAIPWEKAFNYGLPTVLLFALLWLLQRGATAVFTHFLLPIKDRVVKFLDGIEVTLTKLVQQSESWHCNYPPNGCRNYNPTDQPLEPVPNRLHPRQARET